MAMCFTEIFEMHSKYSYDPRRRHLLLALAGTGFSQLACSQTHLAANANIMHTTPASASASVTDEELKYRFRGIRGGERWIDALVQMDGVALYNEKGYLIETGSFSPTRGSRSGYSGPDFVVPKTIRMMYHGTEAVRLKQQMKPPAFSGVPISDVTVEVAARIPVEVLDEVRRRGGGLRLKTRLHPSRPLIGWDVYRDGFFGGDFREAHIFNGQVIRKGWYIDPKTGQRIETDF